MKVTFTNRATGDVRRVKVGFSWVLLFFGTIFGVPFFLRGMKSWGLAVLAVNLALLGADAAFRLGHQLSFVTIWLSGFFGWRGNAETARYYLSKGYVAGPVDDELARRVEKKWGLLIAAAPVERGASA